MKKIVFLFIIFAAAIACKNQKWEFDDFNYTTSYFANQYPVRTLILGDYVFDNSNDNNHRFIVNAAMGGVYSNLVDREVNFVIDETLTNKLYSLTEKLVPLPKQYYSLSDNSRIIIPKGSFYGGITVQLTDAFFQDSLSTLVKYVLPLRIVSATTDSVLRGQTSRLNADPRIAGDWNLVPKDFTLFGIKYVNEFHGKYLLRGTSQVSSSSGALIEKIVYHRPFVESDDVVSMTTIGRKKVAYSNNVRLTTGSPGKFNIVLSFDVNDNCAIKQSSGFPVTGTGKFVKKGDEWGGQKRDVLYLDYRITEGTRIHVVKDTLVFRDKAISFQEFNPLIQ